MWYQKMESTEADKQEIYRNLSAKQPKNLFLSTTTANCFALSFLQNSVIIPRNQWRIFIFLQEGWKNFRWSASHMQYVILDALGGT